MAVKYLKHINFYKFFLISVFKIKYIIIIYILTIENICTVIYIKLQVFFGFDQTCELFLE